MSKALFRIKAKREHCFVNFGYPEAQFLILFPNPTYAELYRSKLSPDVGGEVISYDQALKLYRKSTPNVAITLANFYF